MIIHYFNELHNKPLDLLIEVYNDNSSKNKLIRLLVTSTLIVNKITKNTIGSSLELSLSTILTLIHVKLVTRDLVTISDLNEIVKRELNIVSNAVFSSNFIVNLEDNYENDPFSTILIDSIKEDIINNSPKNLKLLISVFLNTGLVNNFYYSDLEKHMLNKTLENFGYKMESKISLDYNNKLTTLTQKVVFLHILSNNNPELFILLTSTNDINILFILSEYKSLRLPNTIKMLDIIETTIDLALKYTDEIKLSKSEIKLFESLASKIVFSLENTNMTQLLNTSINKVYSEYNNQLDNILLKANNTSNISNLTLLLNSEVKSQVNIINKIKNIGK